MSLHRILKPLRYFIKSKFHDPQVIESKPISITSSESLTISVLEEYLINGIDTDMKVLGAAFFISFKPGKALTSRRSIPASAAIASSTVET